VKVRLDHHPNKIGENNPFMFQTTNQFTMVFYHVFHRSHRMLPSGHQRRPRVLVMVAIEATPPRGGIPW